MYKEAALKAFYKSAGLAGDYFRSIPGTFLSNKLVPGSGSLLETVGGVDGLLSKADIKDVIEGNENPGLAYLPGVNSYRRSRRLVAVEDKLRKGKKSKKTSISESFGPGVSAFLATLLGLGIGSQIKDKRHKNKALEGALLGAATGAGSHLVGMGLGAFTKGRTEKEQEEYYNKPEYLNYIIPGLGEYNRVKTLMLSEELAKKKSK